jgi:valyl-tRNA synthetase
VRFVPENWAKTYFEWMRNIQDWCISRQLWWGHRIPAWYDEHGNVYVARDEQEARAKHGLDASLALRQDEDVLDTWFSSALWPFSTLGWPDQTSELGTFYPTSVLVTGFDIIFFWVARMIMMGLKFMGDVPFREVYVHALIRDHEGQKMSKSKGNVLDPLDLVDGIDLQSLLVKRTEGLMQPHMKARIEQITRKEFPDGIPAFGTDALRLTFASLATTGRDARFDLGRVDGYHRFCNKLWNAAGFAFSHLGMETAGAELSMADRWVRSRLARLIAQVHAQFAEYRFDLVSQALYDFAWHEFCDWYLELTKPILYDGDASPQLKSGARATLAVVLDALLKLLHPLAPFVTEELWLELGRHTGEARDTLMRERLPELREFVADPRAEAEIDWIRQFVVSVRQIRGEMNISPSKTLPVVLAGCSADDRRRATEHRVYLCRLAGLGELTVSGEECGPRGAATAMLGEMRIFVPLGGLIDLEAERQRLDKQRTRLKVDYKKCQAKLANASFVANAPADIAAKEQARGEELAQRIAQLERQLERLAELD